MAKITFIESNGTPHTLEVAAGTTVMQGAVDNGVPGVLGECGGQLACATCMVYVDEKWRHAAGDPSEMENDMMACRADEGPGMRLCCQIEMRDDLDGLIVRIPDSQY